MKGLIALAKKNESISDKIVRLYKEGYSIPEIAKEMEMPKDNVPRILENFQGRQGGFGRWKS